MKEDEQKNLPMPVAGHPAVRLWHDKAAFVDAYFNHWLGNEAENIVFLRLAPHALADEVQCLSIHDGAGRMVQTAVFTPNDQIILSSGTHESISALGHYFAEHKLEILGIFAPAPTSRQMAQTLESLTGKPYHLVKELLHMELQQSPQSRAAVGTLQAAQSQDFDHLVVHRTAIQEEGNTQRPFDAAQSIQSDLQKGALYKWVHSSNRIVASASIYHDRMPTSAYINHVYVEPQHRRQGYASALVSQLCQQTMAQGRVPRLSVDAVNEAAYQVYLKLGFVLGARMDNLRVK